MEKRKVTATGHKTAHKSNESFFLWSGRCLDGDGVRLRAHPLVMVFVLEALLSSSKGEKNRVMSTTPQIKKKRKEKKTMTPIEVLLKK